MRHLIKLIGDATPGDHRRDTSESAAQKVQIRMQLLTCGVLRSFCAETHIEFGSRPLCIAEPTPPSRSWAGDICTQSARFYCAEDPASRSSPRQALPRTTQGAPLVYRHQSAGLPAPNLYTAKVLQSVLIAVCRRLLQQRSPNPVSLDFFPDIAGTTPTCCPTIKACRGQFKLEGDSMLPG